MGIRQKLKVFFITVILCLHRKLRLSDVYWKPFFTFQNASDSKEVMSVREALGSKKEAAQKDKSLSISDSVGRSDDDDDDEDENRFDAKMRNQVLSRRKEMGDAPSKRTQKNSN